MLCPSPCSRASPSSAATHLLPCPFITFQLRALEKAATAPCFLAAVLQRERWAQRPEFLYEGGEGRAGGAAVSYPAVLCAWQHSHPQPHSTSQCRWRTPLPSARSPLGGLSEITAGREAGLLLTTCVGGKKKETSTHRVKEKEAVCFSPSPARLRAQ